ncbi:hypothetical protein [Tenacibaculum singaporense]|uniref:hypothetical protein n=1 Tax=Tenacibaculum singaporense TaxID=2358479 RepID=UPI000F6722BC|nr:hypothetical protein [Tenacibaculum singaporense]RSC92960.1 hypothetical protein EI424_10970 [Tenacibaculum singaporense]
MGIFKNIFRNNYKTPEFDFIKSYEYKDKYFSRIKKWNWINSEQISLIERDENGEIKMTTMEYWFQEMFLDADGQKTINDYLNVLVKQFQDSKMEIPNNLDKFMTETIWSLKTDLNAIEFTDSPVDLNPEYKNPVGE